LQHLVLALGELIEYRPSVRAHQDLRYHFGIEHRAAAAHHLDGIEEAGTSATRSLSRYPKPFVAEAIRSAA
jgi:hypothetical protein